MSELGKIDGVDQWRVIKEGIPTTRKELLLNIDQASGTSGILSEEGRYKLLNRMSLVPLIYYNKYTSSVRIHQYSKIIRAF